MKNRFKLSLLMLGVTFLSTTLAKENGIVEIKKSIEINIPIDKLWAITAEQFGQVDQWISGVNFSQAQGEGINGSSVTERTCDPSYKGFNETTERLIEYDKENYRFKYAIAQGLPKMVIGATNEWSHKSLGTNKTEITMHVNMELNGKKRLMRKMMSKKMGTILGEALEELKFFAETGEMHPRKVTAMKKYEKEQNRKKKKMA